MAELGAVLAFLTIWWGIAIISTVLTTIFSIVYWLASRLMNLVAGAAAVAVLALIIVSQQGG